MRAAAAAAASVAAALLRGAAGHSYLIVPPARNAVDKDLPLFAGGSFPLTNGQPGCTETTGKCGCWCTNGTSACEVAQSCLWFSQGCSIGCPTCDGSNARLQKDLCGHGMKPTVCDPRLRTYNQAAPCGSAADKYQHNPWRAPGTAPVFDPCGKAGGGNAGGPGPGAAFYTDTAHAREGDLGSEVLPPAPSGAVWRVGDEVEAVWGMRANHGGGYQYRLCPKTQNLTEACLQDMPLPFAGRQSLQYANGTRQRIDSAYTYRDGTGVFTADGGFPAWDAWARNPIPDGNQHDDGGNAGRTEFPPPCAERDDCQDYVDGDDPRRCICSGERPFRVSIVDTLSVPHTIPPGEYVLGFRWDCEETAQVWSACADVTIAPPRGA